MATGINPFASKSAVTKKAVKAPVEAIETDAPTDPQVPAGSVSEILEWVGDNEERAAEALEAEHAGHARKTLIAKLEEIVKG